MRPRPVRTDQPHRVAKPQRSGIGEAAIDAVIDIQRLTTPRLHLHHHRGSGGDQRSAGFRPEAGARAGSAARSPSSISAKKAPIGGGILVRVGNGKSAADVDDIDLDAGRRDHCPASASAARQASGSRHCEPTWKLTPSVAAQCAGGAQQSDRGVTNVAPNLPDRSSFASPFGRAMRTIRPSAPGTPVAAISVRILASSSDGIEDEVAHAVLRPRLADGAAGLDRVHEVDDGIGEHVAHQAHFRQRCAVEMAHAAIPQRAQHRRDRDCTSRRTAHRRETPARRRARCRRSTPGRRQCTGSSGRSAATTWSTVGTADRIGGESGGGAARRRSGYGQQQTSRSSSRTGGRAQRAALGTHKRSRNETGT